MFLIIPDNVLHGNGTLVTSQGSTWYNYDSGLAIDGDLATCAMTGNQAAVWWRVDLGAQYPVTEVIIDGKEGPDEDTPRLS